MKIPAPWLVLFSCLFFGNTLVAQVASGQPKTDPDLFSSYGNPASVLRTSRIDPGKHGIYYLSDPGREGWFRADAADNNSADDSSMTLVTRDGVRLKRVTDGQQLNVKWFGAAGNGSADDWYAIQKGIDYILADDRLCRTLFFPPGSYRISKPLLIARLHGTTYAHSSIQLIGPAVSKNIAAGYAAIETSYNNSFAIGIQLGKGVLIRDLVIHGRFAFPNGLNPVQVDTLTFAQWADGSARQNTLSPYAGIVIDPFSDSTVYPHNEDLYPGLHAYCPAHLGRGGSTAVQIVGCSIKNFIVGVMITPSNQQNGELIDVIDCDISNNKVGYAMGQAQSKECHVTRVKCWGPTHTLFDNVTYGLRHGDGAGAPMVDGVNIAGAVKQLCYIYVPSFGGEFRNVYAEGLFRLGYAGGPATLSFEDCQFDFATQTSGIPYPDFYVLGSQASFHDCMLRFYPGVPGARLLLSGTNNHYEGGNMNAPPVSVNIDNNGIYPNPSFRNVLMYYSHGILGNSNPGVVSAVSPFIGSNGYGADPVYPGNTYTFQNPWVTAPLTYKFTYANSYERLVRLSGTPRLHVDLARWTGWFKLESAIDSNLLRTGDFILTSGRHYQDQYVSFYAPTYPAGFIRTIHHDTVFLDNLAIGLREGESLPLYADYYVNAEAPFTGNIAAASDVLTAAQGDLPAVGSRPDMPMLPTGAYVKAVDVKTGTVRFSSPNSTGKSYSDFTVINGYPTVEMFGPFSLPDMLRAGKTLWGGSIYYRYDTADVQTTDAGYPFKGVIAEAYRNFNTHIKGDTSLHKFRYAPVSAVGAGNPPAAVGAGASAVDGHSAAAVLSQAPGVSVNIFVRGQGLQVIVTARTAINGEIARIGGGQASLPVVSCADAFTAGNSSGLYCNAPDASGVVIGGRLAAAGIYTFNIYLSGR